MFPLALVLAACPPPAPCVCPVPTTTVLTAGDGSQVILHAGINITPCSCMNAAHVDPDELPGQRCLPEESTTITAIDVTPDGRAFDPDATLHYKLPTPYPVGYTFYIFQHDPNATCDPNAGEFSWTSVSTGPAVVISTQDFAVGPFSHTSIFALVDLRGDTNAMGMLTTPFEPQDDIIVFRLDVVGSSTHPELEGHEVGVLLIGVEIETSLDDLVIDLNRRFQVGSMLLMHHESNGRLTIWSDRSIAQFFVGEIVFQ